MNLIFGRRRLLSAEGIAKRMWRCFQRTHLVGRHGRYSADCIPKYLLALLVLDGLLCAETI